MSKNDNTLITRDKFNELAKLVRGTAENVLGLVAITERCDAELLSLTSKVRTLTERLST